MPEKGGKMPTTQVNRVVANEHGAALVPRVENEVELHLCVHETHPEGGLRRHTVAPERDVLICSVCEERFYIHGGVSTLEQLAAQQAGEIPLDDPDAGRTAD
ncbi:MAG: hypothetical protein Q8Q20_01695 [bacterium]|nr:hypothetical protein [bacterium]